MQVYQCGHNQARQLATLRGISSVRPPDSITGHCVSSISSNYDGMHDMRRCGIMYAGVQDCARAARQETGSSAGQPGRSIISDCRICRMPWQSIGWSNGHTLTGAHSMTMQMPKLVGACELKCDLALCQRTWQCQGSCHACPDLHAMHA
jgi:hypothetical protein